MKKILKTILVVALNVALLAVLFVVISDKVDKRNNPDEIINLVVSNKDKIAELVTCKYSRDTIMFEMGEPTGFMSLFTDEPETLAVYMIRPTVCAGIDFSGISEYDFSFYDGVMYLTLPKPKILDVYVNHEDIAKIYASRSWDVDRGLKNMVSTAKLLLRYDAINSGILDIAEDKAERTLTRFLSELCDMRVVVSCD